MGPKQSQITAVVAFGAAVCLLATPTPASSRVRTTQGLSQDQDNLSTLFAAARTASPVMCEMASRAVDYNMYSDGRPPHAEWRRGRNGHGDRCRQLGRGAARGS